MKKKILVVALMCFLVSLNGLSVFGESKLNEIKDKYKDSKSKINQLSNEKKKIAQQSKDVESQLQSLDKKIDTTANNITELNEELSRIEQDKEKIQQELSQCEQKLARQQAYFEERLRAMYKNQGVSYLEVLLSSKNLFDFSSRLEMVKKIADYDKKLVAEIKETRESIIVQQTALEKSEFIFSSTKKDLEVKKEELLIATREKQDRMKELSKQESEIEKRLEEQKRQSELFRKEILKYQSKAKYSGGTLAWPVPDHYKISSPYGMRKHPITRKYKMHTGIDIPASNGDTIIAANEGTVLSTGYNRAYGKYTIIDHGGGISTLYAHQSKIYVSQGEKIKKGQKIGAIGITGYSTGYHLHFEVRRNGNDENPMKWYK